MAEEITYFSDRPPQNGNGRNYMDRAKEAVGRLKSKKLNALLPSRAESRNSNITKTHGQAIAVPSQASRPTSALVLNGNGPLPR